MSDQPLLFLLDHDVPDDVLPVLMAAGHRATPLREVLARTAPDATVVGWAHANGAVVVTCNGRHFRRLIPPARQGNIRRFPGVAGLVICEQLTATSRLRQYLDIVEYEVRRAHAARQPFGIIELKTSVLRLER